MASESSAMAKIQFVGDDQNDLKLQEAILDADHSPDAVAYLLVRIAEFLKTGQPIPTRLASRVSNAFEKAGKLNARELRASVLAQELGLTPGTKPTLESWIRVGEWVEDLMDDKKLTQTKAVFKAAKKFHVSRTTVITYLKKYRLARNPPDE